MTPPVPPKFTKRDDRPAVRQSKNKVYCRLQEYLDAQEITRSALSEQTGLTPAAIRGLCDNTTKRFDADTLVVICDFFGIEVGDLLIKVPRE
ncbi:MULTISPECIES: helix-turn-helix domain-containing protein [Leptolyngbya]